MVVHAGNFNRWGAAPAAAPQRNFSPEKRLWRGATCSERNLRLFAGFWVGLEPGEASLVSSGANVVHGGPDLGQWGAELSAGRVKLSGCRQPVFASGMERFARGEHLLPWGLRLLWRGSGLAEV